MTEDKTDNAKNPAPAGTDQLARFIAEKILDLKGEDLTIFRMEEVLPITDYFVIATGMNSRHVEALIDIVYRELKSFDFLPINRSGRDAGQWVLLDYGSIVVHVFQKETREHYGLEALWADAERVEVEDLKP